MSEFKIIESQEEFDKRISERLKRENEKFQASTGELRAEIDALKLQLGEKDKALEKSQLDLQGVQKTIEEKDGKISQYEMAKLKTTIALQNGIPYDLADRLTGKDEAELLADAQRLAGYISKPEPIAPLKSVEPKGAQFEGKDAALLQMSKNLINKGE